MSEIPIQSPGEQFPVTIEEELKRSYLDYAMSVIIGRALPDVRDGLKPVHRRILYGMKEGGHASNKPYKKSARIVGDVMGKYHPHGDSAIYDTIVRLAQDFSMRYTLVDGQGNFGSMDGDTPAAMRYTEIRLTKLAEEVLSDDLDKETVDWAPNYDGSLAEPLVLPSRIPNLLVNGSSGIAVGMATNIPPHNLGEVVDACIAVARQPEIPFEELLKLLPGPDFPTAAFIHGRKGIVDAYRTGRGIIHMRARTEIDESFDGGKRTAILISQLPYQVNKASLVEQIAHLVNAKRLEGISDLRDESDREGVRVVIELKRDAIAEVVLNNLFKLTKMQTTFGIILLGVLNNRPRVFTLVELLRHFVDHRKEVVVRRTRYELAKARERAHILEGLVIALDNLDAIIQLIRNSENGVAAREALMAQFQLSERQAQAILDMRLQRLTALEAGKVRVGVLGLTTPNVPTWEQPANYRGLSFEAMNETAARWIDTLRDKEACDLVVVLAHTGFERDPDTAEPNGTDDENFAWRLARIPGIDVLLTGHTHMRMPPRRLGQVLVSQPASRAQVVTRIDLDLVHEPTGWTISSWQGSNLSTANEVPDPRVMELLEPIHTEVVAALDVEVGEVTGPVSVAGCRLHDCTALDLVHAVQLEASGAQLSLAAILSDHTPDLIPGGVTRRWVTGLYVYPNVLVSLRLSGAQVRDVLEHAALYYQGLECEAGAACDLIVNPLVRRYNVDTMAGVTYRIDPNQPEGSKVRDLRYQGQPIDPEASFVVVTNNYRATGGGGYPHLRDAEVVWTSPVEVKQQIETYLGAHQPWTPLVDGNWSIGPEVELAADAGRGRWATRDSSSSGVAPIRAVPN